MALRRASITGEYYHVYNRAAGKQTVFSDRIEFARFLFGVMYFQSPTTFTQIGRRARTFSETSGFDIHEVDFTNVLLGRHVEVVAFCIMPNHYHLLIRQLADGGLSRYMHRVDLAYTRYLNTKTNQAGHVFQGPFKSKIVEDNEYLTHLSAYIHKNPHELKGWRGREAGYPWSSYQDYVTENRWGGLLAQEIILDQFAGTRGSNYADFAKTSPAKWPEFGA